MGSTRRSAISTDRQMCSLCQGHTQLTDPGWNFVLRPEGILSMMVKLVCQLD